MTIPFKSSRSPQAETKEENMLFIRHRTADKPFALEVKRRALERGYQDGPLFLDSDLDTGIAAGES